MCQNLRQNSNKNHRHNSSEIRPPILSHRYIFQEHCRNFNTGSVNPRSLRKSYIFFWEFHYMPHGFVFAGARGVRSDLIATIGRFSQRTHARPQGWIPVCPVTFFAIWRRVRWRVWRGCRPSLDFSSGFWAVPDPYGTIPGRNRAVRHFFIMHQADAFATPQEFQNEQNRQKTIQIS